MKENQIKKEHPVLFNSEMVRAILDGRKTQTRRVIKGIPSNFCFGDVAAVTNGDRWAISRSKHNPLSGCWPPKDEPGFKCPYGQVGDRLWVRESVKVIGMGADYMKGEGGECAFRYEADETTTGYIWIPDRIKQLKMGQKCPNGCFKELSRIHLEITAIRVERVQDITAREAKSEGIHKENGDKYYRTHAPEIAQAGELSPIQSFRHLWNGIYWDTGYEWDMNPWVWVVEFKHLQEQ